jgi:hypothetical protein
MMRVALGREHDTPARRARAAVRGDLFPLGALTHPIWLAAAATLVLGAWLLLDRQGWDYYTTPLRVRGYHAAHPALRSSGSIAHLLGVAGGLMMLVPIAYMIRKRVGALQQVGSMRTWLEVHIFCGLFGPVLVTFHTSFKFNGLVSVAYWSMVIVALSGVIGRYLYVRIPRTIRGVELTYEQIASRGEELKAALAIAGVPADARQELERFEATSTRQRAAGTRRVRRWLLARRLVAHGVAPTLARELADVAADGAALGVRLASLRRTKARFGLWHVFHLPLVWLMFAIVALHVGLALYLGYSPSLPWWWTR